MRAATSGRFETRPATMGDYGAIAALDEAAFGRRDEATLVERLRTDNDVIIELVASIGNAVLGHIVLSRMLIEDGRGRADALALAPVAVLPRWQGRGIGSGLIKAALRIASQSGEQAVVVLGHEDYYPRFGFSTDAAAGLRSPFENNASFMALRLRAGAPAPLHGRVKYPKAFGFAREWTK